MAGFQNKIGANTLVNLKKETQNFGKSMKGDFGKITMHVYDLMAEMESMKKHKSQKNSQIFLLV
jgi:hypothetical protein